jgi:hypothetical protein
MATPAAELGARTFTRIKRRAAFNLGTKTEPELASIYKVVTVTVKRGESIVWEKEASPVIKIDHTLLPNPFFIRDIRRARSQGRREAMKINVQRVFGRNYLTPNSGK